MRATASAHPNLALVKYWGKRDETLVLPHQSSVSVTLAPLQVTAEVACVPGTAADTVSILGGVHDAKETKRVVELLERARREHGLENRRFDVRTSMNFPMAAGLASSAAAFAALAVAVRAAIGLPRDDIEECIAARKGSGSAARSIQGGFVRWERGRALDGRDSVAVRLEDENHWPALRVVACVLTSEPKATSSRDGMRATVESSPYFGAWVETAEADALAIEGPLKRRDLVAVGELAERSALMMHAAALAANPPVVYLRPGTIQILEGCRRLRAQGIPAYFTLDAGPNPFILTLEENLAAVTSMAKLAQARELVVCRTGGPAACTVHSG